jgi:hypothetical protein
MFSQLRQPSPDLGPHDEYQQHIWSEKHSDRFPHCRHAPSVFYTTDNHHVAIASVIIDRLQAIQLREAKWQMTKTPHNSVGKFS